MPDEELLYILEMIRESVRLVGERVVELYVAFFLFIFTWPLESLDPWILFSPKTLNL